MKSPNNKKIIKTTLLTREEARVFRDNLNVYHNFKEHYPKTFQTITTEDDLVYLKHYVAEENIVYCQKLTLSNYKNNFHQKHKTIYNMHEKYFQDFALRITLTQPNIFLPPQLVPSKDTFDMLYLKRTRDFAVASRDDLTWKGEPITDPAEKEKKKMK